MPVPAPSEEARAVVTGASQNIGEALAVELAARGHHLIVTARREDVLSALAGRLTQQYGVTVEVRPVDLADPADRAKLCDELAVRNISILCANAGTATFGPVASLDPAAEKAQVQLNVLGVHVTVLAPGPVRETLPVEHEQSLVEKLIPDFLWISTDYTAKLSLDALERNKMRVVPGVTSKAMSVASGYTPRAIVTPIVGAVYKKLGGG